MDKLYINYLNNEIYVLRDKIAHCQTEEKKRYYYDIIENLQCRIKEEKEV